MQRFPLGGLDFNLLKVLYALAVKGNMTQAGTYIGLSQPAMSHALKRLRAMTGDELFIRNARGLVMTRHCSDIFPSVKRIVDEAETVMLAHRSFDPIQSTMTFRIGMNDYFSVVLMPRLLERIRVLAPGCVIEVQHMPRTVTQPVRSNRTLMQDYLEDGTIDVAVMTADTIPARFQSMPLFTERRVCIISANNPAAQSEFTFEKMLELGHVKVTSSASRRGWIDEHLDTLGRQRRVVALVPHFSSAVAIVGRSDLIAIMPESVARLFEKSHDLVLLDPPFLEQKQSTSMIWLAENQSMPANKWLRDQIAGCF
ncbi:LysR family transcriptional regulator [Pseudotabrizicola sp. 4114]|uniref:LysR family transcriptional regulator n=1 Tax=Pseudotabrizicola sp. 4114 TaxID=2817731 RepID=UPI00285CF00E|nr:DNA-binding transcriptional LysR family regulator [Pseudorhodobacter sp. 4114]